MKKITLFTIVFLIAMFVGITVPRIMVTITPSLSKRVFYIVDDRLFRRGDYVIFRLPEDSNKYSSLRRYKGQRTTKKIGCAPGDNLKVLGNYYYCNDILIGIAKDYTQQNEKTEKFTFSGIIPDNHFFVIGDHPDSYDSKYFGFIRGDEIEKKCIAIF